MATFSGTAFPNSGVREGDVFYHTLLDISYTYKGGDVADLNNWEPDLATDEPIDLVISKTYAELLAMATGGTLVPGQKYRITDFNNAIVEAISTTEYIPFYNCSVSMDWDSSYDMAAAAITVGGTADKDIRFAGIITLLGSNSTSQLTNFNTNHPVTFKSEPDAINTIVGTPIDSLSADGQIVLRTSIVELDGDRGDMLTLKSIVINGFNVIGEI